MPREQDLMDHLACAGAHIDPALSDRDVERLVQGARRRRRRRTVFRLASVCALACAGVAALVPVAHRRWWATSHIADRPLAPTAAPLAVPDRTLQFRDGSRATRLDSGTEFDAVEDSNLHIGLNLVRGRARFEVASQPPLRSFAVRAGEVTVTVVGTAFTVERVADRIGVAVDHGAVKVDWGIGSRLLRQGESGWFPPLVVEAPGPVRPPRVAPMRAGRAAAWVAAAEGKAAPSAAHLSAPSPTPSSEPSSESLSDPSSEPAPSSSPKRETAGDLLMAADAARVAGKPDQGVALLRRLLQDHRADPRAPLAAFTLGRMLLMELGQPQEAAAFFALVRQLAPHGPFAEDALAREVEAWRQAGDRAHAQARAREYLRLFPEGRRAATVKSAGGIE